jgi:hypothetical protein
LIGLGRYWKNIQSIISGHAMNEAGGRWFVDPSINSDARFDQYVRDGLNNRTSPAISRILERLNQLYPAPNTPGSPFRNTTARVAAYVADAGFNCHHRLLAQMYPGKVYTYQAAIGNGTHYIDQFPTFYDPDGPGVNANLSFINTLIGVQSRGDPASAQAFQTYLVSEIVTGNPNALRNNATIEWPTTGGLADPSLNGILNLTAFAGPNGFSVITSQRIRKDRCDHWDYVWATMAKEYAST